MSTAATFAINNDGAAVATWASLAAGETGKAVKMGHITGMKTFTITGTFGGATVSIEGSNDGTTWMAVRMADYTAGDYETVSAIAAARSGAMIENPLLLRPVIAGGAGTDIKVMIAASSRN